MRGRARIVAKILVSAVLGLLSVSGSQGQELGHGRMVRWTYRADWSGGYSGWMSFPLAQDIGYDPSIYTQRETDGSVLFHNFVSHGQTLAWFGFVRPLKFWADKNTMIELDYRLRLCGRFSDLELMLIGSDGHKYSSPMPSGDGEHQIRINAADLALSQTVKIEAVMIRGRLQHPPTGSESKWVLERFVLRALHPAQVALSSPSMNAAVDGSLIAREVVRAGGVLHVELESPGRPGDLALYDPAGAPFTRIAIALGQRKIVVPLADRAQPGLWRAEVEQGEAKTVFRFLVLGTIPAHGHLLLSQQRLDALSHDARYAGLRQEIHRRALMLASRIDYSSAAGDNIALMPSGPGIQPAAAGQLEPYVQLVEDYSNTIAYNALDYRLNNNHAALVSARRALLAMAQWRTWSPPRFHAHGLETYYEVGCITQRVAFGYDLIADQLSAEEKAHVARAFWEQAVAPVVEEYFLYNRDPVAASNWMANSVGGALAADVAVAGDSQEWEVREAPALADLEFAFEELLHGLFPGDGSEAEPAGYENFAMQGVSWGMSALANLGIEPQGAGTMLRGFWWPYYATVRPGTELDTGDFDGHLKGLSGFAWGAQHSGIPALQAFYEEGTSLDLSHGAPADQNGHQLEELLGPLDLSCCSKPTPAFNPPPPSRIFPQRGSAVLRSGWGPDATVISLRVGPWFNHEHHDEGSFQVAAFGRILVDEAGYASYYTDPHYADYFSQAAGHNTLLIDGDPFSQAAFHGRYWPGFQYPHFTASLLASRFDYLDADLTSAYDGRLESYKREFVFLKPDILVIRDRVRAATPHRFSWLLHTPGGATLEKNGSYGSIQLAAHTGANATVTAAGPDAAWKVETPPIKLLLFKNLDGARIEPPQMLFLSTGSTASAQFMVGLKLNANLQGRKDRLEAWTEPAGEGLRTVQGKQAAVVFRAGTGLLRISAVTTDGTVLAQQGTGDGSDWMAVDAHTVDENGHIAFQSSTPASVAWERVPSGVNLRLHNSAVATIEVFSATAPKCVEVDDLKILPGYKDEKVILRALSPGDHRILIR